MNQAIHSVDLLTWLMGPVVEVRAQTGLLAHERIAVEDVAVATVRFANGALGVIEASTAVYPGYLKRIEIHGTDGSAVMEEEDIVKWDFAKPSQTRRGDPSRRWPSARAAAAARPTRRPSATTATPGSSRTWSTRSRSGTQPAIDGPEGRRSVEIILAIYKAAETGRAVPLPLAADPVLKARKSGVGE